MSYKFDEYDIRQNVLEFMRANGIVPYEPLNIVLDGNLHRFRTVNDKSGEKSGAYVVHSEHWPAGIVQDWNIQQNPIDYKYPRDNLDEEGKKYFTDEKMKEVMEMSRKHQAELKEKMLREKNAAITRAQDFYKQLPYADNDFPYLVKKGVKLPMFDGEPTSGVKYCKNNDSLCIPLEDINGELKSLQWIDKDGNKKFEYNTSPSGAFFSLDTGVLDFNSTDLPILICEGVATMLTVYAASDNDFRPVIAAMNCGNLYKVAEAVKNKYPEHKIFIMADNDHETEKKTGKNPGLDAANQAYKKLKLSGVIYPPFKDGEEGTDFNDYAAKFGINAVRNYIKSEFINIPLRRKRERYAKQAQELGTLSGSSFADFCEPPAGKSHLIQDWLPAESLVMLFAPSGNGKGFVALDMAFAVACPYINKWHEFNVSKHGNVVYATGEGQRGLRKRAKGLASFKGVALNEINMHFITEAVPLDDKKSDFGVDKLIVNIGATCPNPDLVIIDTVNCFMNGNENDTQDATRFINSVKRIMAEFHCSVMLLHHTGQALENRGRARGSSVFKGALDVEFTIVKSGSVLTLQMKKIKDAEEQNDITFKMRPVPVPGFYKDDGSEETTCILEYGEIVQPDSTMPKAPEERLTQGERFARDTYKQAAESYGVFIKNKETGVENVAVFVEDWRKIFYENSSADTDNTKRQAFNRAKKTLLEDKKLLIKKTIKDKEYYCVSGINSAFESEIITIVKNKRTAIFEY